MPVYEVPKDPSLYGFSFEAMLPDDLNYET